MAVYCRGVRFPANVESRVLRSLLFPRHRKEPIRQLLHHFAGGDLRGLDGLDYTVCHEDVCSRRSRKRVCPCCPCWDVACEWICLTMWTGKHSARRFISVYLGLPFPPDTCDFYFSCVWCVLVPVIATISGGVLVTASICARRRGWTFLASGRIR